MRISRHRLCDPGAGLRRCPHVCQRSTPRAPAKSNCLPKPGQLWSGGSLGSGAPETARSFECPAPFPLRAAKNPAHQA